jgi:hypothetical protein
MMDRLKGGTGMPKPKRKIRVSGAVAFDLDVVRDTPEDIDIVNSTHQALR